MKILKLENLLKKLSTNDFKNLPWEKLHVKPEMSISHRDEIIKSNIGGLMYNHETQDISQSNRGRMKEKVLKDGVHQFVLTGDSPAWLEGSNRVFIKKIRFFFERLFEVNAEDTDHPNPQSGNSEEIYARAHKCILNYGTPEEQDQLIKFTIKVATKIAGRVALDVGPVIGA
jgi:hypothetical protein